MMLTLIAPLMIGVLIKHLDVFFVFLDFSGY